MKSMFAHGVEQGIEQGRTEGAKEQSIAIAKKMLEKNINIETIMETTGLDKEEIEKLKE